MALETKRQKITKHKDEVSHFYFYFCQKWNFKTYFVYFHTFSYKFKVLRTPTEFGLPVSYRRLECMVIQSKFIRRVGEFTGEL